MLGWAVGVLPFCSVGGKQGTCCFGALSEMEVAINVMMLHHVLSVCSVQVRSIYTFFIAYEINILVQELEHTSFFRAGIYSRIPN